MDDLYSQTFTGLKFHYFNPSVDEVDIVDIAHALGNQCRFNGHTSEYYSVAEHSYHASYMVEDLVEDGDQRLEALLHDASEAYIGDIPAPFKRGIEDTIKPLEKKILKIIFDKYDAGPVPLADVIKQVDLELLYWERQKIMGNLENEWEVFENVDFPIKRSPDLQCWGPKKAKQKFFERFQDLTS